MKAKHKKKLKKYSLLAIAGTSLISFVSYLYKLTPQLFAFLLFLFYATLLLFFFDIPQMLLTKKETNDELIDVINYVREWWRDKLETGEDFRIDESEGYEVYIGNQKYYALSITRYGKETKMFVLVGTNPIRVVNYLPYSSIYYSNPIEVIKDVFGVVPTPAPSQKPIEYKPKAKPKKQEELKWEEEDEILAKEQEEI